MTNTKETAAHRGLAASTVLLCTGAAAGVSGFGSNYKAMMCKIRKAD